MALKIGDKVVKKRGYSWPGVVVAAFPTLAGEWRYVVECTAPGAAGALHIYSAEQLEPIVKPKSDWPCPLGRTDCHENCGSYGCGN